MLKYLYNCNVKKGTPEADCNRSGSHDGRTGEESDSHSKCGHWISTGNYLWLQSHKQTFQHITTKRRNNQYRAQLLLANTFWLYGHHNYSETWLHHPPGTAFVVCRSHMSLTFCANHIVTMDMLFSIIIPINNIQGFVGKKNTFFVKKRCIHGYVGLVNIRKI